MRGFRFRLASVLVVRRHELEAARQRLAEARRTREALEVEARRGARALREAEARARVRLAEGLPAGELRGGVRALAWLQAEQRRIGERLDRAARREAQLRGEVTRAHGRVRALEILEARQRSAHERKRLTLEQRELDEIAVRQRAGGGSELGENEA